MYRLDILTTNSFYNNIFVVLFFLAAFFIFLNKFFYYNRFMLNVTKPNIYVFEYESHSQRFLSLYNTFSFILNVFSFFLFTIALISYTQIVMSGMDRLEYIHLLLQLIKAIGVYFIVKNLIALILYLWEKKSKKIKKLIIIRIIYQTYGTFYLYVFSFLIYFFPYKIPFVYYLIITVSVLWLIFNFLNMFHNMRKHIHMKSYQLFLYLCLSEILPLIILIWWISFQIL